MLDFPDSKLDRTDFYQAVEALDERAYGRSARTLCSPSAWTADSPATSITRWQACSPAWRSSGQDVLIAFPSRSSRACSRIARRSSITCTADFLLPDRQPIAPPTVTARIEIGKERFEKKGAAFQQHTTQAPLFERVRKNLGQGSARSEMYHLVATRDPREAKFETDLFEGVVED